GGSHAAVAAPGQTPVIFQGRSRNGGGVRRWPLCPPAAAAARLAGMRLLAISDLHLANPLNREAVAELSARPEDWLILAGDLAERLEHLDALFAQVTRRFARVIWVPGNHELWTVPEEGPDGAPLAGEAKYQALVALARGHGVITPEDPFPLWTGPGGPCVVAPLFLLYDYSFRPEGVSREQVIAWAR